MRPRGACRPRPRRWRNSMCWPAWPNSRRGSATAARVLVDEPILNIVDGRHPVLDILEPQGTFVPNDTVADRAEPA